MKKFGILIVVFLLFAVFTAEATAPEELITPDPATKIAPVAEYLGEAVIYSPLATLNYDVDWGLFCMIDKTYNNRKSFVDAGEGIVRADNLNEGIERLSKAEFLRDPQTDNAGLYIWNVEGTSFDTEFG